MPTWNAWDAEVQAEREGIRAYGSYEKYVNRPGGAVNTYKGQAALELAARLEAEQKAEDLRVVVMAAIDVLDCEFSGSDYAMQAMVKLKESIRSFPHTYL